MKIGDFRHLSHSKNITPHESKPETLTPPHVLPVSFSVVAAVQLLTASLELSVHLQHFRVQQLARIL